MNLQWSGDQEPTKPMWSKQPGLNRSQKNSDRDLVFLTAEANSFSILLESNLGENIYDYQQ